MDNDKPEKENPGAENGGNPIDELKKQLEGLFGGKNVKFDFIPGGMPPEPQQAAPQGAQEEDDEALKRISEFSMKPREIRDYLNRFVIKQDEAKKVLAVSICDHYNHVRRCIENPAVNEGEYGKQNILILGPTGVGKTYLMRTIAKLIGVPFVKADATKFSETGFVGGDVEDLVRDLVKTANGNVDLAQYGIIYIDEIDKIASVGGNSGRDVSGRGVQINLLKLMEDSNVNVVSPQDMMGQMQMAMGARGGKKQKRTINTRYILFIVSGAFDKLGEDIAKRMNKNRIGFSAEEESAGEGDPSNILVSSEGSILKQYKDDFKGYGIDFTMTPEAVSKVAELAYREKTGARGLMTVLERTLRDFKFELPSSGIKHFELSTETVENPKECLKRILLENGDLLRGAMLDDLRRFAEKFATDTGFALEFDGEATDALLEKAVEGDKSVAAVCADIFRDLEHGLAIVSRNTGLKKFPITKEAVADPDKFLSDMVVKSFSEKNGEDRQQ